MNQLDSLLWLKDCVDFRVLKGWYSQEKKYQAVKPNGRTLCARTNGVDEGESRPNCNGSSVFHKCCSFLV